MNLVKDQGLPDFVMLEDHQVNEEGFLGNLKVRFDKKQIYTYIGEQLVAMNPFTSMGKLYSVETLDAYRNRYLFEVQPHIFALADDTFRALTKDRLDQCVIVTGESGAGKTESAKIFMQYISAVSGGGDKANQIKNRLLESNPVLEAFGNAKTVRNDNSSRFGKYMEIQFTQLGRPVGGRISQYLLEKSRVVTRAQGERTFHIFYQLLSDGKLCKEVGLSGKGSDYHYIAMSNTYSVERMDDAKEFVLVQRAMRTLGFSPSELTSTWRILAALLHLGNVTFAEVSTHKGNIEQSTVTSEGHHALTAASNLIKLSNTLLERSLTARTVTSGVNRRMSTITVPLSVKQAVSTRDSLAKALYNKVFSWVTETVNHSIAAEDISQAELTVGVLDIYGFEIFEENSFEQFCINFCNEKLQQLFIQLVLRAEQDEYIREGIEWTEIDYFNNGPIVDLIQGKRGMFKLLDEACLVGEKTAIALLTKFDQNLFKDPHYESYKACRGKSPDRSLATSKFRIHHYAGEVDYLVAGFIEKNIDTLFRDLVAALLTSDDSMIQSFYDEEDKPHEKARQRSKQKRPPTAGTQFSKSVNRLCEKLKSCQPHYIRCIKSNERQAAFKFNEERIRHQCRYLNLVETVRVRRAGFCHRQEYEGWYRRYHMIADKTWPTWSGTPASGVQCILDSIGCQADEYRKGKTKLFVRAAKSLFRFEELRAEHLPKVAVAIQRKWKGFRQREAFVRLKASVLLQRQWRALLARRRTVRIRSARCIQMAWMLHRDRTQMRRLKAVCRIQAAWRGHAQRVSSGRTKAALRIQTAWRRYVHQHAWLRCKAAKVIQRYYRGFHVRVWIKVYKSRLVRKAAACSVQRRWRGVAARRWVQKHRERLQAEKAALLLKRQIKLSLAATKIWKRYKFRKEYTRHAAALKLQRMARGMAGRRRAHKLRACGRIRALMNGFRGRRQVRRLRAALFLQGAYRHYILRRFVTQCARTFKARANKSNAYGKHWKFPDPGTLSLEPALKIMVVMHHLHWGHTLIKSLDPTRNVLMRFKVQTLCIFQGNKTWKPERPFTANYLTESHNPQKFEQFEAALRQLFTKNPDDPHHIQFADELTKVNRKHKPQCQVVVVTEQNILKCKAGNYKLIKTNIPIRAVRSICMSKLRDTFCVLKMQPPHRDMVLDLGTRGCERLSEFVTVVYNQVELVTDKPPKVEFVSDITYNNSRTESSDGFSVNLRFAENPEEGLRTCLFKGKGSEATVFYPKNR